MLEKKCKKCKSQWRLVSPFGWRLVSPFVLRPVSPFGRRPVSPFGQRPVSPFGGRLDIYTYMHQRQKCEINQGLFCKRFPNNTIYFDISIVSVKAGSLELLYFYFSLRGLQLQKKYENMNASNFKFKILIFVYKMQQMKGVV